MESMDISQVGGTSPVHLRSYKLVLHVHLQLNLAKKMKLTPGMLFILNHFIC
jgi:hypothetical protein